MLEILMPDADAIKAAHARLSVLLPSHFHSPLKINAEIERTATTGVAKVRILKALQHGAELTFDDLRYETQMGRDATRSTLVQMIADGLVEMRLVRQTSHKIYRLRDAGIAIDAPVDYHRERPPSSTRLGEVLAAAEAQPGSFMVQDIMQSTGLPFERAQNFVGLLIRRGWLRRLSLIGRGRPGIYEVIK